MSESEEIIRIAAKGDGVTASGRHVPRSAPGDFVDEAGHLTNGAHHIDPACRHFGKCGGCQLQHCDEEALSRFVHERVVFAAEAHGLEPQNIAPVHLSPSRSRQRATLHAVNGGGRASLGFRESGSHRLVDIKQCEVLIPELFALVEPLRAYLSQRKGKYAADIDLALVDQGVDCAIRGIEIEGLDQTENLLDLCRELKIARLSLDQGFGLETFWEPEPVSVTLGGVSVAFPSGSFLQATQDGEQALTSAAKEWLSDCSQVADLFSGLGTFAFALCGSANVIAAEAARDSYLACRMAANRGKLPVEAMHRDLFRSPLRAEELASLDGVLLDPPRAGARSQVEQIAASGVSKVVYISCNPSSWARDCVMLKNAGYQLVELRPVGQFRWSTHVELASLFVKNG